MITLPATPDPIARALGQLYWEQFTGIVIATLTLSYPVAETQDGKALLLVFKNGLALSQGAGAANYTVTGTAITLGTAAIAGDNFIVWYHYRAT